MVSANKIEILRIAEAVAQEKMIDKEIVISALEEASSKAEITISLSIIFSCATASAILNISILLALTII